MPERLKQIGELARELGCTTRTIRYYEELGLIRPVARTAGRFRLYDQDTQQRIALIQRLKAVGLPLRSIKQMFLIRQKSKTGREASRQVIQILDRQRKRLQLAIKQYQDLLQDVEAAMELVTECFDCEIRPTKKACQDCPVVTSRGEIPLSFKVIL